MTKKMKARPIDRKAEINQAFKTINKHIDAMYEEANALRNKTFKSIEAGKAGEGENLSNVVRELTHLVSTIDVHPGHGSISDASTDTLSWVWWVEENAKRLKKCMAVAKKSASRK